MPTPAHRASDAFAVDPLYDALAARPTPAESPTEWLYGPGETELFALHRLVTEGAAAAVHVDYVRNYGRVAESSVFRVALPPTDEAVAVRLEATGRVEARLDWWLVGGSGEGQLVVNVAPHPHDVELVVVVRTAAHVPGGLWVAGDLAALDWQWSADGGCWLPAARTRGAGDGTPPHTRREPVVTLPLGQAGAGLLDLGFPVIGRPVVASAGRPRIRTGESPEEAMATSDAESHHEVFQRDDGLWTSVHELGFRYLTVEADRDEAVIVDASFHPARYSGAFACSDELLTRVWMTSAFTLRLTMHELMVDGIKRDRMPWAGDQAVYLAANAYAFADADIAGRSLAALGRPGVGFVNGIADYSLWWVIAVDEHARYFGGGVPGEQAARVFAHLDYLATFCDDDGLLVPRSVEGATFPPLADGVFIDWGVEHEQTALQALWFWALRSGASIARRAGDIARAGALDDRARRLGAVLRASVGAGADWRGADDAAATPHANLLACLSGLADPRHDAGIRAALAADFGGTPFMRTFALRALAAAGGRDEALAGIRAYWGGMLERGAVTFWEDFDPHGREQLSMYGRPFGRSLCHGWATGPAALLPEIMLGVVPLSDGWSTFAVDPYLGELDWAAATVPTPHGDIVIEVDRERIIVRVPAATTMYIGDEAVAGPRDYDSFWKAK